MFCSSRPGNDESELKIFVSFRTPESGWGDPVDLTGVLGVEPPAKFPYVSPDGKYLFFLADGDIYWIDAGVITTRRDKTH